MTGARLPWWIGDNRGMVFPEAGHPGAGCRWRTALAAGALFYALAVVGTALVTAGGSPQPLQSNIRFWNGAAHVFLVARGGVLDRAGIRPGDDILALDGHRFRSGTDLGDRWQGQRPGATVRWTVRRNGRILELEARVGKGLAPGRLFPVGLSILLLLTVGAGSYLLRPGRPETLLFLLFCVSTAVSDACTVVSMGGTSWQGRILTFAYTMTSLAGPALLLHLFLIFPERGALQRRLRVLLPVTYGAAVFLGLVYYLPTVFPSLTGLLAAPELHRTASVAYDLSVVLAYLAGAVVLGSASHRAPAAAVRRQARLLFSALALLVMLQVFLWEVPLRWTGVSLIPVQSQALFDLVVPLAISAAIVRYHLFGINILVRYGLVYSLASVGAAAIFVAAVAAAGWFIHRSASARDTLITALAAAVSALAFAPIRRWVQETVDRRLYSRRYSYRGAVRETAERLAGILDTAAAARFLRDRIEALLEPSWAAVLVRAAGAGGWLRLGTDGFEAASRIEVEAAERFLERDPDAPEHETAGEGEGRVALAVPIRESGETLGVLLLGPRPLDAPYLPEDLDLLTTLAGMAGPLIHRGRLLEEQALGERLAAVGAATSALAHELKNPVAAVKSSAAVLRRRLTGDPRSAELTEIIEQEMDRLERTIGDVLSWVRPGNTEPVELELGPLVEQLTTLLEHELASAGVTIESRVAPGTPRIVADPERIRRLLLNLLLNARQAMPTGGIIEVEVRPWYGAGGRTLGAEIAVLDRGTGFTPESLARAFEPFFTTRRLGTGLGLANVRRIAREHGGDASAANREGGGAVVTVRLARRPVVDGNRPGEARRGAAGAPPGAPSRSP